MMHGPVRQNKIKRMILLTHKLTHGEHVLYEDEAARFATHERTIRRDIEEIGKYLDIEVVTIKVGKQRRKAVVLRS